MSSSNFSYCSWCFQKTRHVLLEQNYARRNLYKCSSCGQKTLECRFCKNMTKGGNWDNELCAEHDGSITSFERLSLQLNDIADYKKIFQRDVVNIQKVGAIAAFSIGGAAVLGPLAFAAAPAIGGAVGAGILGLSGAAATNAGLAAVGGGAIAAGGLGIAGGAAILGATGTALGGAIGGVISNSYFKDVEGFEIELLKKGKEAKVLFIDGFLTEKTPKPSDWEKALTKKYPDNPWYYVRWDVKKTP